MSTPSNNSASVLNTQFFSKLAAGPQMQKEAAEAATEYTRLTLRDEGIVRKILPFETITESQLDNQLGTDHPVKIIEKEVQQPIGASVPFNTLPNNIEMNWSKYPVYFARILTENFIKDIQLLKGWNADIRNIFKDNAIKDMMTSEDKPFMALVNAIVSPAANGVTVDGTLGLASDVIAANGTNGTLGNKPSRLTGKVQYYDWTNANGNPLGLSSGFTRDALVESKKILSKAHTLVNADKVTPIRLKPELMLMNINTAAEYEKFQRNEMGGDYSQELFQKGIQEGNFLGIKHEFTMKDDIILDGEIYYFAAPQFVGKAFELEAPTMFLELRAYLLEFFIYSCVGASIGNGYSMAKAKLF